MSGDMIDREVRVAGPEWRPGVWIMGRWRCDREAKYAWMRDHTREKPKYRRGWRAEKYHKTLRPH